MLGHTTAEDRVYTAQKQVNASLESGGFPCMIVYTETEEAKPESYAGDGHSPIERDLTIGIEFFQRWTDEAEDELDLQAAIIESLLDGWHFDENFPSQLRYEATGFAPLTDGDDPVLALRLGFSITYQSKRFHRNQYDGELNQSSSAEDVPGATGAQGDDDNQDWWDRPLFP